MRIGLGGGCHWCTEAVFQSLRGVSNVQQGFIKSLDPHDTFSEAVIVAFDPQTIPLDVLVDVHLRTHASTSQHKMRGKYRSAVYVFSDAQADTVRRQIKALQSDLEEPIVTMTLPYDDFKPSLERFQNYYRTNTEKPFCTAYIDPKLSKIRQKFSRYYDPVEPLS
jgi:peptide-methionine (S)-S-oxide reductase